MTYFLIFRGFPKEYNAVEREPFEELGSAAPTGACEQIKAPRRSRCTAAVKVLVKNAG